MKKIKVVLAIIMVLCGTLSNSSVARAAETGITVVESDTTVSKMTMAEWNEYVSREKMSVGKTDDISQATRDTSYTAYRYTKAYDFYSGDLRIARAEVECIVWHYTDGKVHLYSRTITPSRLPDYEIYRTYGRIVNTDGTLSYTTGDSVNISSFVEEWDYAIDFRITPSEHSFSCYQI